MSKETATPAPQGAGVFYLGSGGGIRTPDLWVMSPTSCRCSTPRRALGYSRSVATRRVGVLRASGRLAVWPSAFWPAACEGGGCPRRPRLPWGRPHSTLRRCAGSRPGSGWDRVGPARSRPRAPPTPGTPGGEGPHTAPSPRGRPLLAGRPRALHVSPQVSRSHGSLSRFTRPSLPTARPARRRSSLSEGRAPPAGAGRPAAVPRRRMGSVVGFALDH
jgi:hypothetical protein